MQNYQKLAVWAKSHALVLHIYQITKSFPVEEKFGLTSQLRRATISIPANIAEGCGRFIRNDTAHFLQVALGSLHESEYYFLLAKDLCFLTQTDFQALTIMINDIKAMLIALIKKVRIECSKL